MAAMNARASLATLVAALGCLTARGETPAAFSRRCIPADCVAPPSHMDDRLGRRAATRGPRGAECAPWGGRAGRLAALAATAAFHHGPQAPRAQMGRTHDLTLRPENVHWGYYDASVKPVLHIASGDTVRVETMVARGVQRLRAAGVQEDEIPDALKAVERAVTDRGPGAHPLTGPIWIEGAEPGDVLAVRIVGFEFLP